ncbi:MAG: desulfoferrodoxin family protein [Tractidigestivibacter sp.]|uniref:desulfoferrodoxin family protein n=1 Tax=Tractidigestivibacter sp. TaxID=2847320 RepID=UPI003D93C135
MADIKIYRCNHCGNIVVVVKDGGVNPVCCGEPMELLVAGSTDAAVEKHVPVLTVDGDAVVAHVGEVDHPMTAEHLIEWILYTDDEKTVVRYLKAGDKPEARFHKGAGKVSVYAYCNLHGLWKAEL